MNFIQSFSLFLINNDQPIDNVQEKRKLLIMTPVSTDNMINSTNVVNKNKKYDRLRKSGIKIGKKKS